MSDAAIEWSSMVSATDNVDVLDSTNITCSDEAGNTVLSGDTFGLGNTTLTCVAVDAALNEGECRFVITVLGMRRFSLLLKHNLLEEICNEI